MFHAPGEAEAVCAALNAAGCVDACASKDGDCLLYGAEVLLPSLKLSVRSFRPQRACSGCVPGGAGGRLGGGTCCCGVCQGRRLRLPPCADVGAPRL